MGLYRKATPADPNKGPEAWKAILPANNSEPAANKSKRGRPVKATGDPKRDARNKQQRELMQRRRAAK